MNNTTTIGKRIRWHNVKGTKGKVRQATIRPKEGGTFEVGQKKVRGKWVTAYRVRK